MGLPLWVFFGLVAVRMISRYELGLSEPIVGCADLGAIDFGQKIHGYVYKFAGLAGHIVVNNGLIDMYSKSGNLDLTTKIFSEMLNNDLLTWTTMISGLALHGKK
ncbi:unnamed protein product [Ilex paraguariensis]|uniref:Pentatricopeptide repeat-containing protein n=1 Tax=Ilex paraguariensis TaxID=185542 RepID=A0ABC8R8X2_9AQUA